MLCSSSFARLIVSMRFDLQQIQLAMFVLLQYVEAYSESFSSISCVFDLVSEIDSSFCFFTGGAETLEVTINK